MDLFLKHELRMENDGYKVILHLDQFNEEFGVELGSIVNKVKSMDLKSSAVKYVREKLPNVNIVSIAVMSGGILLSNFSLDKVQAHEANFNMSYLYFGNTSSYISQIDRTKGNLNLVSPSYFDLNADGSLHISKQFDPYFVNEMHNRNIKVVPFLSNHWDRNVGRAALQNRELLSSQIADFIIKNNLDGVQVDIENVTEADRDHYTDLVKLLREKLPAEKEVSVAVAANPNSWTKGWHGSYDYSELAKYSNYIMIMAYDESYPGGVEGPVASYPWVERSIQYALNKGVPSDKIVLGVPFYGRYWKAGSSTGGEGISNTRVQEMLSKYGGTVTFDATSKSPKATITIKETDSPIIIGGKTLGPGTYYIWFENNESIKAKLDLVHKYKLKGTGSWSLGQENPIVWNDYKTWMVTHTTESIPATTVIVESNTSPTYQVQAGDSLSKIAAQYNTTVQKLMEYNQLSSDKILVGQVLYLAPPPVMSAPKEESIVLRTGWEKQDGLWFYYSNGQKKTGWLLDRNKWYFLKSDGVMATGWVLTGGKWYYLDASGAMKTGWLKDGNTWYFLESSGAMKTGWLKDGGTWYYLENSGAMKTGWLPIGGKKYYLNPTGAMAVGWKEISGKWYYFYSSGEMAVNTTIQGYKIDQNGVWIR